jgi:uncharacterized SAM-binding protein YcdF (DUF218 family)
MNLIVDFICSVTGLVCIPLACAAWLRLRPASRAARRCLAGVVVGYLLASIYAVPFLASRVLVRGFHHFSAADGKDAQAIVLLGAGTTTILDGERHFTILDRTAAMRVLEASRVYDLIGPVWVISSGGVPQFPHPREPSAVTMRQGLVQLGVPESKILLESESLTTHDEAVLIAPMLRSLGVTRSVLVTSDVHMRRSIGTFRAAGISVVPAIAPNPMKPEAIWQWLIPTERGFYLSESLLHEALGIPYYGVRGWWKLGFAGL